MNGAAIVAVDERDSNWERDKPRFRVYLQEASGAGVSGPTATYDVVGADIVPPADRMRLMSTSAASSDRSATPYPAPGTIAIRRVQRTDLQT